VQAIQQVSRGESSLHPSVARRLLRELSQSPSPQGPATDSLTEREIEVLQLVAKGWSNREISDHLSISDATVRTHVSSILAKLNLCSRTQAALYALREGLASLQEVDALIVV
jgi:NarL family two-component system response regulator LiaR